MYTFVICCGGGGAWRVVDVLSGSATEAGRNWRPPFVLGHAIAAVGPSPEFFTPAFAVNLELGAPFTSKKKALE